MYDFIMLDNKLKTHKDMLPMKIVKERINRLQIETIPTYILIIENFDINGTIATYRTLLRLRFATKFF